MEAIGDNSWHLRVEAVPEDQEDLDQQDVLHAHCLQIGEEQVNVSAGAGGRTNGPGSSGPLWG